MKKLKFIAVFLAFISLFPVFAMAHEGDEPVLVSSENTTEQTVRVERAKKTFPIRLSDKEQTRLADRCATAQEKLTKVSTRLTDRSSIITKKYNLIELHLVAVQKRLTNQQIDTSIIDLLLTNFLKLTSEYDVALSEYHLALDDAVVVDCVAEPQSFKALLEDVRVKRQVFVNKVDAIKDFTRVDLKTSFDALRARLKSQSEES